MAIPRINKRFDQQMDSKDLAMIETMNSNMDIGSNQRQEADLVMGSNLLNGLNMTELERYSRIHTAAVQSRDSLVNFLTGALTPLNEYWMEYGLQNRTGQEETIFLQKEVQKQLQEQTRQCFYDGALEINQKLALTECCDMGTGILFSGNNGPERKPYFKRKPTDQTAWKLNDFQIADTVHCEYDEYYGSLKQKFPGIERISSIRGKEKKDSDIIRYKQFIKPNAPNTNSKMFSIFYYYDNVIFYDRDNLSFNPFIIFPYELAARGPFGVGPTLKALHLIKNFYKLFGLMIHTAEKRIAPPFQTDTPFTNRDSANFDAGGLFHHPGIITPLQTATGSYQTGERNVEQLIQAIKEVYNDSDIPLDLMQYTSATAIEARERKKYEGLTASALNLERVLCIPLIENTLRMLIESGKTVKPNGKSDFNINPEDNKIYFMQEPVQLRITSGIKRELDKSLAREMLQNLEMTQTTIGNPELFPEAQGLLKGDVLGREIYSKLFTVKEVLRDEIELDEWKQEQQQQMQEALAMQQQAQGEQP